MNDATSPDSAPSRVNAAFGLPLAGTPRVAPAAAPGLAPRPVRGCLRPRSRGRGPQQYPGLRPGGPDAHDQLGEQRDDDHEHPESHDDCDRGEPGISGPAVS